MSELATEVRAVTKRFGGRVAVDRFSLEVRPAEAIAVLGPSGCGKTTLLRLIAGLEEPDDGEIWIAGQRAADGARTLVPPHKRGIGFVFQDLALWPHMTVWQHLDFVLSPTGVARSDRGPRIAETIGLVKIVSLADRHPHQLSGGEQQRVALARALVGRPRLLLLDEPFSSVDADLRSALRTEVARVQRTLGVAAIVVTHDREDAEALADRIVMMRNGQFESERRATGGDREGTGNL
jgi:ABC-type Fe3+/spermidine/putrescine transport system ATPase subunit